MTTTVQAVYENGKLVLAEPLPLPEQTQVQVTIESPPAGRIYSREEKAAFLLNTAVSQRDYEAARMEVKRMDLDPDAVAHERWQ